MNKTVLLGSVVITLLTVSLAVFLYIQNLKFERNLNLFDADVNKILLLSSEQFSDQETTETILSYIKATETLSLRMYRDFLEALTATVWGLIHISFLHLVLVFVIFKSRKANVQSK